MGHHAQEYLVGLDTEWEERLVGDACDGRVVHVRFFRLLT